MKKFSFFSDKIDMTLLICSILAAVTGILVINSAAWTLDSHIRYILVQSLAFILGIGAMTGTIFFSYKYFEKLRFLIFGLGIGMLILVLAIGTFSHGTQGWIELGPITIQPSEIAKVCFIITLSMHITKNMKP